MKPEVECGIAALVGSALPAILLARVYSCFAVWIRQQYGLFMAASSIVIRARNDSVWLGAWERWPLVEGGFAEAGYGRPRAGYDIYREAVGVREKITRPEAPWDLQVLPCVSTFVFGEEGGRGGRRSSAAPGGIGRPDKNGG